VPRLRPLVLLSIFVLLAWIGVTPVQAHALLMRSIPDANAMLTRAPAQVDLYFSEPITPKLSKVSVLDASGKKVDAGDSRVDPADSTHFTVTLQPMNDGVYTVVWSVISAADGHQTSGSFPFAVGNVNPNAMAGAQTTSNTNTLVLGDVITKGLLYLAAAAVVGERLFVSLVWKPSRRQAQIDEGELQGFFQFSHRLALMALAVFAGAEVLSLLVEAGKAGGIPLAWPWQPTFITVLLDTRIGVLGIARLGLVFALAGLLLPPENRWNRWVGLAAGLLLLGTFSLESHAVAEAQPLLPVLADWIHLAAVSVWVGGLFSFLGGMWLVRGIEAESRTRFTSFLIPHFTRVALASVGALTVTGIYSAILRVGTFEALFGTLYGNALILKVVIAFMMVTFGATHILITTPAMRRAARKAGGSPGLVKRFHNLLTGEAVLGILILVWVGLFTSLPPARVVSTPTGFNQTTKADDLTITLNIDPNRPGLNTFTARLISGGKPVVDAHNVSLEFTSLSGLVPASKATLVGLGNGSYTLKGGYLGMPDKWDIKVVAVRQGKFDAYGDFKVDNSSGTGQSLPWRALAASMIVVAALCYAFAFRVLDPRTSRWMGFGLGQAAALVLVSIILFIQAPSNAIANPLNPVLPNQASVTAGKTLYKHNCLPCHGPLGKGDGPAGLGLNPRPADLTYHAMPGVHSDGQLFEWISNGFPNSAMPAFAAKLSDTDRWNLVNYIRTLARH
jgi:copper transport protein